MKYYIKKWHYHDYIDATLISYQVFTDQFLFFEIPYRFQ